ncbi:hypothetical protein RDABS01_029908, partial [Bienertia sinuspersici]
MEEFDPGDEGYWEMEDFEDYSKSYECEGKLSRIWRSGVNLGKKMVITGVMVSSAPFVLPPLVALSAIGVAFSVPAGFVFCSYACGEKLMNTLLPMPSLTPLEENGPIYLDEEEYEVYRDDVDNDNEYDREYDLGVEEQEFEEDTKKDLEMRIELLEENNEVFDSYDGTPVDRDELDRRATYVSEIVEEDAEDSRVHVVEQEQPMDSKILEGVKEAEAEAEITLMNLEGGWVPRVSEIIEEGYEEEDFGEYKLDEEEHLDAKVIPELLEGIREAESEISLEEEELPRFSDIIEDDVGEHMEDEEQPQNAKATPKILEGIIGEENEISMTKKEEDRVPRVSEIVEEGYESDEEQPLYAEAIPQILEGIREGESEISLMEEEEGQVPRLSEIVEEGYEEDVKEYVADEKQLPGEKAIPEILEGIKEAENEISLMEKEEARLPRSSVNVEEREYLEDEVQPLDAKSTREISVMEKEEGGMSSVVVAAQLGGENEINIEQVVEDITLRPRDIKEENDFAGVEEDQLRTGMEKLTKEMRNEVEDDQKRKDSPVKETPEGNEESEIVPVKAMSQNKENKNLTISEEVQQAMDDEGLKNGLEGIRPEELRSETTGLIEKMRDEGKGDKKRKDSPAKETPEGIEESGLISLKDMSHDKRNENLTIPEVVEPATVNKGVISGHKEENHAEHVKEDIAFALPRDNKEDNGFALKEEEELRSETTRLIEIMRDEDNDDQKRKDSSRNETSEENVESGRLSMEDMSQDKGNMDLTVIPKGLESATDDQVVIFDFKSDPNIENINVERDEPMSAVENQLQVNVKLDGGHTVTEVHQGSSSDKLGNLIPSNEDAKGMAAESGFGLSDSGTATIEIMRDEDNDDQKRKDSSRNGAPEENVESGRLPMEDTFQDKGNMDLTIIPKGLESATDDQEVIFDFKSDPNIVNTSVERDEPISAVENQLRVNVKLDGGHTVTEVHRGSSSDKLGNLIPSNEDARGMTAEREDKSLKDTIKVTADYHEVVIESAMPVSEVAETAKDRGTSAGSDKVKQEEEKIWEEINAMRTIVGYTNTPHSSCAEELKALYDFTGIELPTSSNDSADLVDINQ